MLKQPYPFENSMSRAGIIAGLVYFPIHVFLLPLFLPQLLMGMGMEDQGLLNLVYYGIGIFLVLTVYLPYLRANFDTLLDRLGFCFFSFLMALGIDYVFSYAVNTLIVALVGGVENPNDMAIAEVALQSSGAIRAVGIFMAPIVEEILFRGVIFGAVREKNRFLAYAMSMLMFAIYHVWQFALLGDMSVLIYILQYLPVGFALCWLYERCGSIWMPIGFHMMINAMSFAVEKIVSQAA